MHEDERKKERESERWIEKRADRRVYINKPREKIPKIIPARRRNKSVDTGMRAGQEEVRPCRRQGGA